MIVANVGETLTGKARIAGVIGYPVGHSLSPRVHGYWLRHYRIDGAYIPMSVHPKNFAAALAALSTLGFAGCNITVPFKEAALATVDTASAEARRIGAVNTIVVGSNGLLNGSNSDASGFLANIEAGCRGWRADRGPAVILGAGGAARAVCVALQDGGAPEIRLANRTYSRAVAIAVDIGHPITPIPWEARTEALRGAALLVNTTTLGMSGEPALDLDLTLLPRQAVVTDVVYSPLRTDLLQRAGAGGHPVVDGLGMLLHQARSGFAAWYGVDPEVTEALRGFVLAELVR
ncbi:MAG: shikimate dehydrogenase [Rhodospirillales bacterium]